MTTLELVLAAIVLSSMITVGAIVMWAAGLAIAQQGSDDEQVRD